MFHLSASYSATLIGFFLVGGPELFLILGAALAGKEAITAIKQKIKDWFRVKRPVKPVGKVQYKVGLWLFFGSIVISWLATYFAPRLILILGNRAYLLTHFILDLITITGFFVLGESFWEKFKKLFIWECQ